MPTDSAEPVALSTALSRPARDPAWPTSSGRSIAPALSNRIAQARADLRNETSASPSLDICLDLALETIAWVEMLQRSIPCELYAHIAQLKDGGTNNETLISDITRLTLDVVPGAQVNIRALPDGTFSFLIGSGDRVLYASVLEFRTPELGLLDGLLTLCELALCDGEQPRPMPSPLMSAQVGPGRSGPAVPDASVLGADRSILAEMPA